MAELADAAHLKSYEYFRPFMYLAENINFISKRVIAYTFIAHFRVLAPLPEETKMPERHDPERKGPRLQAPEQQPLAVLKLFRGQESSHQHKDKGRELLQRQGNRRGLVSAASRETPRWGDQQRKDVWRSV